MARDKLGGSSLTGLEKIIKEIRDEAAREADGVVEKAKAEAEELVAAAKAEADAKSARVAQGAAAQVADIESTRKSAIALQRRQRTLATKQQLLAETLDEALRRLYALEDEDYFNLLGRLAVAAAQPGEGELMLNEKDRARLPADFSARLEKALGDGKKLFISDKTRPIDGGFVLKYGDVEENCSFRAMFDARRDEFSDLVRDTLFA